MEFETNIFKDDGVDVFTIVPATTAPVAAWCDERGGTETEILDLPTAHDANLPSPLVPTEPYHPLSETGGPQWPRKIGVGIKVENVLKVDNVENCFTAVFKVSYEWMLTKSEHDHFAGDAKGWTKTRRPPWEPEIYLPNAQKTESKEELTVPFCTEAQTVFHVFEHERQWYTVIYLRYRCIITEVYELQNFPFDCQDLTFILESADASKATLHPRFKREDFVAVDMEHCQLPEWEFHMPVLTVENTVEKGRAGTKRKSRFVLQLKLQRRHHFYVNRIIHTAALLSFGTLLTWSIDVWQPHRLVLCFTILLTLVAFQHALANKLPQVRYFTLIDYYLVFCQRFIMFCSVQHAILKQWFENDWQADRACFIASTSLYVFMQILFYIVVQWRSHLEMEKLPLNAPSLENWMAEKHQKHASALRGQRDMMISSKSGRISLRSNENFATYTSPAPRSVFEKLSRLNS